MNVTELLSNLKRLEGMSENDAKTTLLEAMYLTETSLKVEEIKRILSEEGNSNLNESVKKWILRLAYDIEGTTKEEIRKEYNDYLENGEAIIIRDPETGEYVVARSALKGMESALTKLDLDDISLEDLRDITYNAMGRELAEYAYMKKGGNDKVRADDLLEILKTTTRELYNINGRTAIRKINDRLSKLGKMSEHDRNELLLDIMSQTRTCFSFEDIKEWIPEEEWEKAVEQQKEKTKSIYSGIPSFSEEDVKQLCDDCVSDRHLCIAKDEESGRFCIKRYDDAYLGRKDKVLEINDESIDNSNVVNIVLKAMQEKVKQGFSNGSGKLSRENVEKLTKSTIQAIESIHNKDEDKDEEREN